MTNNPTLEFRSDVALNTPVSITLDAADWNTFMAWAMSKNLDGATYIVYQIGEQVKEAIYTPASLKATDARYEEETSRHPMADLVERLTGHRMPGGMTPEDFAAQDNVDTVWLIRCVLCGSESEYAPNYNDELICGHNGMRQLIEIRLRGSNEVDDD